MGSWDKYDFGKRRKPRAVAAMRERVRLARESIRLQQLEDVMTAIANSWERLPLAERRRARVERAREALAKLEREG